MIRSRISREIYELVGDYDAELTEFPNSGVPQICRLGHYGVVFGSCEIQVFKWINQPLTEENPGSTWEFIAEINLADPKCFEKTVELINEEIKKIPKEVKHV